MTLKTITGAALLLLLSSCKTDPPEDVTNTVNKAGGIESAITVTPLDSTRNLLTTTHKIWLHDSVYKTVQYHDTLPSLGTTLSTAENSEGDTKQVPVKKEYEIYITIR